MTIHTPPRLARSSHLGTGGSHVEQPLPITAYADCECDLRLRRRSKLFEPHAHIPKEARKKKDGCYSKPPIRLQLPVRVIQVHTYTPLSPARHANPYHVHTKPTPACHLLPHGDHAKKLVSSNMTREGGLYVSVPLFASEPSRRLHRLYIGVNYI